jgi:hypothetical protein
MEPFSLALKDNWGGNKLAKVIIHQNDELVADYLTKIFK